MLVMLVFKLKNYIFNYVKHTESTTIIETSKGHREFIRFRLIIIVQIKNRLDYNFLNYYKN